MGPRSAAWRRQSACASVLLPEPAGPTSSITMLERLPHAALQLGQHFGERPAGVDLLRARIPRRAGHQLRARAYVRLWLVRLATNGGFRVDAQHEQQVRRRDTLVV